MDSESRQELINRIKYAANLAQEIPGAEPIQCILFTLMGCMAIEQEGEMAIYLTPFVKYKIDEIKKLKGENDEMDDQG